VRPYLVATLILLAATASTRAADSLTIVMAASSSDGMSGIFGDIKTQMKHIAGRLKPEDKFDVMFFTDGEPDMASPALIAADGPGKKKAMDFITAEKTAGTSDPVKAVKAALALKPGDLFLMLDQVPDGPALIDAVKAGDSDGKTQIHIVYFAGGDKTRNEAAGVTLKEVAKIAHGDFKSVTMPDAPAGAGPVVFACSNSGSMIDVLGEERNDVLTAVAALPPGTKYDVVLFTDGQTVSATPAPVPADKGSRTAVDDFLIKNPCGGHGEPVAGVKAALALKPAKLVLILDQVPDPAALTRAFDAGDPQKKMKLTVTFLTGNDPVKDKTAAAALDKITKARHGTLKTVKKSDLGPKA
jgi:hypothetical protein